MAYFLVSLGVRITSAYPGFCHVQILSLRFALWDIVVVCPCAELPQHPSTPHVGRQP